MKVGPAVMVILSVGAVSAIFSCQMSSDQVGKMAADMLFKEIVKLQVASPKLDLAHREYRGD